MTPPTLEPDGRERQASGGTPAAADGRCAVDVVLVVGAFVFLVVMVAVAAVSGRAGRRARSRSAVGADFPGSWSDGWSGGGGDGDGGSSCGGGGGGGGGGDGGGGGGGG